MRHALDHGRSHDVAEVVGSVPMVLAVLTVGLDATILSVALPTLGSSLDASTGQLQWFVAAYTLVFAAALIPGGMLGDRYGRKKMLIVSLLLFGVASIACALAPSAEAFIAARALLGLGGALMLPMVLGVLPVLFDETERPRAVGAITAGAMLGYPIGPLLGGWMLTRFDWSWVFLINPPVVALAVVAVAFLLPESRSSVRQRIDLVGVALSGGGLALLTYGVISAGERGVTDTAALAEMAVGARARRLSRLDAPGRCSARRPAPLPLLEVRLGRNVQLRRLFRHVRTAVRGAALLPGRARRGRAGKRHPPSPADRRPARRGSARRPTRRPRRREVGDRGTRICSRHDSRSAPQPASPAAISRRSPDRSLRPRPGLVLPATIDTALGAVSDETSGVSSGVLQALRMVGGVLGAAILGAIINTTYRDQLEARRLRPASQCRARQRGHGRRGRQRLRFPDAARRRPRNPS